MLIKNVVKLFKFTNTHLPIFSPNTCNTQLQSPRLEQVQTQVPVPTICTDPRIRIHTKMSWIRNTDENTLKMIKKLNKNVSACYYCDTADRCVNNIHGKSVRV